MTSTSFEMEKMKNIFTLFIFGILISFAISASLPAPVASKNSTESVSGIPPVPAPNSTTTSAPATTTTTSSTTTTTSKPTPAPITTTPAPNSTTTVQPTTTPVPSTSTLAPTTSPTTTSPPPTTQAPPKPDRSFDLPSFVGGIILALGVLAIGYVVYKFYRARTDPNYRTL